MKAFQEVSGQGFAEADFEAPLIFIPDAINSNHPQSPNVVVGWGKTLSEIPDCDLKIEVWRSLKQVVDGLGKAFQKAFTEACGKPSVNQEQETGHRKQDAGKDTALRASATTSVAAPLVYEDDPDDEVPEWPERPLNAEERQQQLIAEDGDEDVPY